MLLLLGGIFLVGALFFALRIFWSPHPCFSCKIAQSAAKNQLKSLHVAQHSYWAEHGTYADLEDLPVSPQPIHPERGQLHRLLVETHGKNKYRASAEVLAGGWIKAPSKSPFRTLFEKLGLSCPSIDPSKMLGDRWEITQDNVLEHVRDGCRHPPPSPTSLKILTYNVLADRVFEGSRVPALFQILKDSNADIIALQEVAPWFLAQLMAEDWVNDYRPCLPDGRLQAPGGQFILSRFPILHSSWHVLPGDQKRTLLVSTVKMNGEEIDIATTHMESPLKDGTIRARQLDAIFSLVQKSPAVILLGDFNFGDGEEPETSRLRFNEAYLDAWMMLNPTSPGFTWNMEKSAMAKRGAFPNEKSRRLDRILIRSKRLAPISVTIIGDEALGPETPQVFPSDHFGLMAALEGRLE